MKKTYCDVCGEECDDIEMQNAIELTYEKEGAEDDLETLLLSDVCWTCRNEIATAIKNIITEKKKA